MTQGPRMENARLVILIVVIGWEGRSMGRNIATGSACWVVISTIN